MVSRSSRLFHAALVVVCGAGIVYAPVQAQTSLTVPPQQDRDWGRYCGPYQACSVPRRRAIAGGPLVRSGNGW